MYGNGLLTDVVGEKVQAAVYDFIEKEKLDILGSPIRSNQNDFFEPNVKDLTNYTFNFEIGLAPEFDIAGLDEKTVYEKLSIEITEEILNKDFEALQKRNAKRESIEGGDTKEDDLFSIEAVELEGDKTRENGLETKFDVLYKDIHDKDLKKVLSKAKKESSFNFDINTVENKDEKFVRKYLLQLDDSDDRQVNPTFSGVVKDIQRLVPSELNQEFYNQVFGPDKVKDEKGAKEVIKEELAGYYDQQTSNFLDNNIMEKLMEETKIELPTAFLKKWLIQVENKTEDEVGVFFDSFLKDMKWNLINTKLAKEYEVKVEMEDVKDRFRAQVQSYFGMTNGGESEYLEQIIDNLMSNKEQVNKAYQEAQVTKIFGKIKENINTKIKKVSVEEFTDMVKKVNEKNHKH
jgi:trigger factor